MRFIWETLRILASDLKGSAELCRENRVVFLASSVAFFAIFSICPLLIVSFSASHALLRTINAVGESPAQLSVALNGFLPAFDPAITVEIQQLLRQNTTMSIMNLLLLIWAAYELFRSLNYAFERISTDKSNRSIFWGNFLAVICFMIVISITTFLLFLSSSEVSRLRQSLSPYFENWSDASFQLLLGVIGVLSVIGGLSAIFKFMPTEPVSWRFAFLGSVLFLIFFAFGHVGFTAYGHHYMAINRAFYGPFITLIMVSAWVYFISIAFLFSAQYALYLEAHYGVSYR